MSLDVGQCYERDDSRRVIKEVCEFTADPRLEVIYALYRRQVIWRRPDEWWYKREGYCSRRTFERWMRKAKKVST